ncbi:MarR family winged helix-turn-helix transcriptional regulator [[Eubacterium] hominis]|uniref:MarR family winged helix-turn-helix transcriptional regulator n=1 Tax=[Eubacterium] hominis TaxID=2764325 RepID=UPI003A4D9C76
MDSFAYQQKIQELDQKMHHHLSPLLRIDFEHYHITDMQYHVLSCISEHDGITISELSKILHQDAGNMSTVCKKLEKLCYLFRLRSKKDERVFHLHLTKEGMYCVQRISEKIRRYYEKEWNRYNEADKEMILHALNKLNQFFESFSGRKDEYEL